MRSVHLFAMELCRFLEEEQVEYALLGDACVSSVPAAHRIEFVVTSEVLHELPLLLHKFCQRGDVKLVMYAREHRQGWRYMLSWLNRGERPEFVTVEVFCDFIRRGRTLLTGQELLRERHFEGAQLRLRSSCFVAAPAMEFIYYLLRCVHESVLSEEQAQHLDDCWQRDPDGAAAQVARFWDRSREGGMIGQLAEQGDWSGVRALLPALRAALRRRRRVRAGGWLYGMYRRVREWLRPSGLLLACLGPEGVGKASVIGALKDRPLAPFREVHTMELRPRVFLAQPARASQPQESPRGRLATMAKLMMFAIDYWIGYCSQIRPRLVRTMLVLSNRYFDDVLVDPRRYRMARPFAFARALLPWIPRPDLWLVLDAPSEVISARNSAASAEESSRQRREYRRLLRGYENVVLLDARQPLDKLVAQAERAIVAYLEDRTSQELGLPRTSPINPFSTEILLFFCRRNIPVLSRFVRILFNSDIYCRLPAQLYMPHPYGIVIHSQAVVGDRVTVMQQVAIGDKDQGENVAPVIGNDVYIGAGARVLGDVHIGDGVTIGANAIVTQDIPPGVTVVGANRIVNAPAASAAPSARSVTPFPVGVQRGA